MFKSKKHLASFSLGVMGIGFLSTLKISTTGIPSLIHGGFEAGLVGGLADWFAVTALFRHPLGLPIPHTALLPKNRKKVSEGIVYMIENDWLSKASMTEKINKIPISEKIINMVETQIQSSGAIDGISLFIFELINHIDEKKIASILADELKAYLLKIDVHKVLTILVNNFIQKQYDEKSFDYILEKIKQWVEIEENRNRLGAASIKGLSNLKLDGLMNFALQSLLNMVSEERMGQIISNVILRTLENLQEDGNMWRRDLISLIRNELNHLSSNQKVIQELESWKANWITQQDLIQILSSLLSEMKLKWIHLLKDSNNVNEHIVPFLINILERLKSNTNLVSKLDMWLQKKVIDFIDENHSKIGQLVRENLDRLDNETLTELIEDRVGKDLQWIRVNGAVCGFVIGVILSVIKLFSF